jgi:valyl-tRNA synthetase
MIETHSADAVRYWASSTGPGKDSVISEEKIQTGAKLATKLWNVARFSQRFLEGYQPEQTPPALSTADRWILARLMQLIERTMTLFHQYDYAAARSEIEGFFWRDLSDNYLEMAKQRLYDTASSYHPGAKFTLHRVLESAIALFAPFLPYVTDRIYQAILRRENGPVSVHLTAWPQVNPDLNDQSMLAVGEALIEIATAVRRFKSENQIALTTPLAHLHIDPQDDEFLAAALAGAQNDLSSVTRAHKITVGNTPLNVLTTLPAPGKFTIALIIAS